MKRGPLNGKKFHPLTEHGIGALKQIISRPMPVQEVNPGLSARLLGGGLVVEVDMDSPYKKHKGGKCAHFQATLKGRRCLAQLQPPTLLQNPLHQPNQRSRVLPW